jgi:protein CpxP
MKKLVAALGLSILFVLPSFAQHKGKQIKDHDPQEMSERMTTKMAEKLDLTEAQKKDIQPFLLEFHKKEMEAHKRRGFERKELVAKMKTVLSPEQFEKFEKHFKIKWRSAREKKLKNKVLVFCKKKGRMYFRPFSF